MSRIEKTRIFIAWQRKLRDERPAAKIAIAITRLSFGLGDVGSVGDKVSEVRIDYGPGYRLYFTRRGDELIILLCGGDKSSQDRDIRKAKEMAAAL
ncbi:MAG: type II toxin-antitoxin system RelE/ParE family toxin [Alphaproteobacteria bacterium]|nr:MAG: type II toxin-antitoxin system RelE/ParE family toxin [Alphaproteobacteria bacterium]